MTGDAGCPAPPLFIVGSARSGTTLLYHSLLSSGQYAMYRGEPAVFDLVRPRYGELRTRAGRSRLLREWPRSHLAQASGFGDPRACEALLESVRSSGEFLRRVMSAMAERQGVRRWAVWGPDNLLLLDRIRRELPDARCIHMVRDGRDVALSLAKEGWIRPFPWDRRRALVVAALHWQWKLQRGRRLGHLMAGDYMELAFEALVERREEALAHVAAFLGHPLDPSVVHRTSIGTLRDPNSTFRGEHSSPVSRWRARLTPQEIAEVESAIGETLDAFGYERATPAVRRSRTMASTIYPFWFTAKHLARTHTPLGRCADPARLRLT